MVNTAERLRLGGVEDWRFEARQLETAFPDEGALQDALRRRLAGEPLQYILGTWDFYDLTLKVGPGVLIPRPDTETVCDLALEELKHQRQPVVADLCAGSGCIGAVLLRHHYTAKVFSVENSPEALPYLKENLAPYGARAQVVEGDVLRPDSLPLPPLTGIVCNPPYLTEEEYACVQRELYYEPKSALVAPEEGLLFYRAVAEGYRSLLQKDGFLIFEIGYRQSGAVRKILEEAGYSEIKCFKDYGNNWRAVSAVKRDGTL